MLRVLAIKGWMMRWKNNTRWFACVAGSLGALACSSTAHYDYAKEPDPRAHEFQIGPRDQLSIHVWKNPDLSGDVTVRPDGIVTLPLVGNVRAAGHTPTELQTELVARYREFLRGESNLVVSIAVAQVNSYSFTVSGNVEKPGYYDSKNYITAVEAIAMAGGPNKFAGDSIFIVRGNPVRRIPIDLRSATAGTTPEQNLVVLRGDIIVVP